MPNKNRKVQSKVSRLLDLTQEISTNLPKITIVGFEKMLIENYKAILEYQEHFVRVSTHIGILNISGYNLNLNEMTTDDLLITGTIDGIDFESISEE